MDLLREYNSAHLQATDHHHHHQESTAIRAQRSEESNNSNHGDDDHHQNDSSVIRQMDLLTEDQSSSSSSSFSCTDAPQHNRKSLREDQSSSPFILVEDSADLHLDPKLAVQQLQGLLSEAQAEKKAWVTERDLLSSQASQLEEENHCIQSQLDAAIAARLDLEASLRRMTDRCSSLEQEKLTLSEKVHSMMAVFDQLDGIRPQPKGHPAECSQYDLRKHLTETELSGVQAGCTSSIKGEKDSMFRTMVQSMDMELFNKADALARSCETVTEADSPCRQSNEIIGVFSSASDDTNVSTPMSTRLWLLEEEVQTRDKELDELKDRIRDLELSFEQVTVGSCTDPQAEQLKDELIRLQKQNAFLSRREQELLSTVRTESVLQEEIQHLQEESDFLAARLSKVLEAAKDPHLLEKVADLEQDLAEAMEINNMYKSQLASLLENESGKECGGSSAGKDEGDRVLEDLLKYKQKAAKLEEELNDIHVEYSHMSLKFAQAENARGELILTIKKLENQLAQANALRAARSQQL